MRSEIELLTQNRVAHQGHVFVEFSIFPLFKSRLHKIIRFILIILMVHCEKVG